MDRKAAPMIFYPHIRGVKAFTEYTSEAITKETVIAYKKHLQEHKATAKAALESQTDKK